MKVKIIASALLVIIICVCSVAIGGIHPQKSFQQKKDNLYKFAGKLNGKIPVFMWFVVGDSVIKGEVTYLKTKRRTPIAIVGTLAKNNEATIYEFNKKGYVTGIYYAKITTNSFNGTWVAPGAGQTRELKCNLVLKDSILTQIDTTLKPISISGDYEYHFGKTGSNGGIALRKETGNVYSMEINCITPSPQNNIAGIERTKAIIKGNAITYKSPDEDCGFRVRVFKNFVVIDNPLKKFCTYGVGAGVDGVFMKVSEKPSFAF